MSINNVINRIRTAYESGEDFNIAPIDILELQSLEDKIAKLECYYTVTAEELTLINKDYKILKQSLEKIKSEGETFKRYYIDKTGDGYCVSAHFENIASQALKLVDK